jgi:O-antigen/teichoic acid export membrane protein
MRRQVIGLFAANILTILVVGLSFIAYSRLLSPPEFGLYAAALSAATLLSLILDGGLKTSIIKKETELANDEESSIALLMLAISVVLILLLVVAEQPLLSRYSGIKHDAKFINLFVGIALVFYPFVTLPTAKLERRLEYGHIAWIESAGMILERGAPALLLIWTGAGLYSFIWALLFSRAFRALVLAKFHAINLWGASPTALKASFGLLREGGWIQFGTISSVVRDNLHTLLVGPLFGKEWIGYYAWALQICLVSSQIFAQISARVSLPLFAQADCFEERWSRCLYQVRVLAILTLPVLCGVWLVLPTVDNQFFHGKWHQALLLIPFLFLRMVPGLATTPLGPLIMVQKGGRAFARVSALWTAAEIGGACLFLYFVGPTGLAWSYAIMVWLGLWLMVRSLGRSSFDLAAQLTQELWKRPSLLFAVSAALVLAAVTKNATVVVYNPQVIIAAACVLILFSYVLEPELRRFLVHAKTKI